MTVTYPCQGCGASAEFVPGTTMLRCPYCGKEEAIAAVPRQISEHALTSDAPVRATLTFTCGKCAAQTQTDLISGRWPFCGSPLAADPDAAEQIPPEALVPFEIGPAGVRDVLRQWVSSRWFAPSALKRVSVAESVQGVYYPHWTFDTATVSAYDGERGDDYWTTETYTTTVNGQTKTQTRQVRHTRWRSASGTVERAFDDVLVTASERIDSERLQEVGSWPLTAAVPFQTEYLAGYQTLRYEIDPEPGFDEAKAIMQPVIEADCRDDIGGDHQRLSTVDTTYSAVTHKLLLLPIWIVCYAYAGRQWQVLVNASTGTITGQRPYSKAKIAAAITLGLLIVAVIVVLLSQHA